MMQQVNAAVAALFVCVICQILSISLCDLSQDYWSDDYDSNKNCQSEDIIKTLDKEALCAENFIQDPNQAVRQCKTDLYRKAVSYCNKQSGFIVDRGELLYCSERTVTLCCINNLECEDNWLNYADPMFKKSRDYLKNKEKYLERQISEGYRTCHPLSGYDATICRDDCRKLETSDFAKECQKRNGLFKCCIRRDKAFCDECRFCCTVPFCTYPDGNGNIFQTADFEASKQGNQEIKSTALEKIYAYNFMFQSEDYRCLKPDSNPNPEQWRHYDPDSFISAKNKHELEKAESTKFDKNFFNFENEQVFAKATTDNAKKLRKFWQKSYGIDFAATFEPPKNMTELLMYNGNMIMLRILEPCLKDCMAQESSAFAKKCRKNGGHFKCCPGLLDLSNFRKVRAYLVSKGLISSDTEPTTEGGDLCISSYLCSTKNAYTGLVEYEYMTPNSNPLGGQTLKIGDQIKRIPFKFSGCHSTDTCSISPFAMESFLEASTQAEFCSLKYHVVRGCQEIRPQDKEAAKTIDVQTGVDIEKDNYVKMCAKEKSNVKTCPKKRLQSFTARECYNSLQIKLHLQLDENIEKFRRTLTLKKRQEKSVRKKKTSRKKKANQKKMKKKSAKVQKRKKEKEWKGKLTSKIKKQ